jgi:hypothetical protein
MPLSVVFGPTKERRHAAECSHMEISLAPPESNEQTENIDARCKGNPNLLAGGPVALVGFMHLVEDRKLPPWLRITSDKLSLM